MSNCLDANRAAPKTSSVNEFAWGPSGGSVCHWFGAGFRKRPISFGNPYTSRPSVIAAGTSRKMYGQNQRGASDGGLTRRQNTHITASVSVAQPTVEYGGSAAEIRAICEKVSITEGYRSSYETALFDGRFRQVSSGRVGVASSRKP